MMSEIMKIEVKKCACGHVNCGVYQLSGIGRFSHGSGFDKDEAELIVKALNAYEKTHRGNQEARLMIDIKDLANEVNGAFSHNEATGNLDKAAAIRQALDWVALRYNIARKPDVCTRSGELIRGKA